MMPTIDSLRNAQETVMSTVLVLILEKPFFFYATYQTFIQSDFLIGQRDLKSS